MTVCFVIQATSVPAMLQQDSYRNVQQDTSVQAVQRLQHSLVQNQDIILKKVHLNRSRAHVGSISLPSSQLNA
jgi:hypothetical protein